MRSYLTQQALMMAQTSNTDWPYTSLADYLLDRGHAFESKPPLTEEEFAFLTSVADYARRCEQGRVFPPKQCFANAMMLTLADADDRLTYCEGFAVTGLFPVHHAWLTLDGKLVDVTRSLRPEATQEFIDGKAPQADLKDRVLGAIPEGWEYLGVEFQRSAVRDYIWELGQTGSLIEDYDRGFPLLKQERLGNFPAPDPNWWASVKDALQAAPK